MKSVPSSNRRAGVQFLAVILTCVWAWFSCGSGAWAIAVPAKESPPRRPFAPEAETKFNEFVNKAAEARRKLWELRMNREIEEIAKITQLNENAKQALESPAAEAANLCVEGWRAKFSDYFRRIYSRQTAQIMEILEQILPQAENYAQANYLGGYVEPFDHEVWLGALQRILTPEQKRALDAAQSERREALRKEIKEFLKASVARTRDQAESAALAKGTEVKLTLSLEKERAEQIDGLAKSLGDQVAEAWRARAEKSLISMDEDQRRQIMKAGQFYFPGDPNDFREQQASWKERLGKLLSSEEVTRLTAAQEARKARRARAMGHLMLVQLDEEIAFTPEQRDRLESLAERLVNDEHSLSQDDTPEEYFEFSRDAFLAVAAHATDEQLQPILDATQRKHWEDACNPKAAQAVRPSAVIRRAESGLDPKQLPPNPDPEEVENAISDYFHNRTVAERKRVLAEMLLKVEDAARVLELSPQTISRLQTAARGATEEYLAGWKTSLEQNIRGQIGDATPQMVKQRLASLDRYQFQRAAGPLPEASIWQQAIKTELTPEQRAEWQKNIDFRTRFREKAIHLAIMAEFDRKHLLTEEQWTKLDAMLATTLNEYGADIARMFSPYNPSPWYLQSYSMFLPFAGLPEQDLKTVLAKEQWERWTGSTEFSNANTYWQNIQQNHAQRVRTSR